MSVNEKMIAIADAIRAKTGGTDPLTLDQMAQEIEGLSAGGYDDGYEAGTQAEYNRFWDAFQQNGNKTNYDQAFAYGHWTDETYNPKYDIVCKTGVAARQTFYNTKITSTKVPIRMIGSNMPASGTFAGCSMLKTIVLLELNGVTPYTNTFNLCSALENITIAGSIDTDFNISATAVLTDASVQSIIDHLKDLTGATAQTLTFHATVGGKLTDEQKSTISAKNWTLAY